MNVFLVTMFVGNQPIRIQHFLKMNYLSFLKTPQSLFEKSLSKTFEFPRVTLQEKRKNSN